MAYTHEGSTFPCPHFCLCYSTMVLCSIVNLLTVHSVLSLFYVLLLIDQNALSGSTLNANSVFVNEMRQHI